MNRATGGSQKFSYVPDYPSAAAEGDHISILHSSLCRSLCLSEGCYLGGASQTPGAVWEAALPRDVTGSERSSLSLSGFRIQRDAPFPTLPFMYKDNMSAVASAGHFFL